VAQRTPAHYDPHLDGLFTYCLSVLCDHDAAIEVLGDVLAISERQHGRCPSDDGQRKAWLYALARWACLRKLTEQRSRRPAAHAGHREPQQPPADFVGPETAERRRSELALLAWPEAAGTTPEQREILELAVRHQLGPRDVAAVLSMELLAARELLASAACEVERTRAALAVVETGDCPSVARLTGDHEVLLSAALRQELVRHVDDCPRCRRIAERAEAAGPWPGSPRTPARTVPASLAASAPSASPTAPGTAEQAAARRPPARLPLVEAPRDAAYFAMKHAPRARATAPRFGRNGFPMDPKDRAARRDRLRARAVTTTVVATVVAAPVLALWAAYRGAPETGEGHDGSSISAREDDGQSALEGQPYDHFENAGNARNGPAPRFAAGGRAPDVSVEVISDATFVPLSRPGRPATGHLTVAAQSAGSTTDITLRASGGAPVRWSARTDSPWLRLSRTSGTLAPGESITIRVLVDHRREPDGPWSAQIAVGPTGSVVKIDGYGFRPPPSAHPSRPGHPGHHHRHHHRRPGRHGPDRPGEQAPSGHSKPSDPSHPTDPSDQDPSDQTDPGPSDPAPSDPGDPPPSDPAEPGPPEPAPTGTGPAERGSHQ
jgi:DNA-directed RNA polymerase specialized sigma24 family protein